MKPAPFEHFTPTTIDEAILLLSAPGQEAKVLAGGQSLVPLLNLRLVRPARVVDINGLRELDYVRPLEGGGMAIGALTRHRTIERSPVIASHAPLWSEAAPHVGDRQVRNRGTIGGSLAHADPSSEFPTVALATESVMVVQGAAGRRSIPAQEFFVMALTTALEPDELLVEIRIPPTPEGAGSAFLELARRHGDFALVSAAAVLSVSDGRIREVRIALGGVALTPIRARRAEAALIGEAPGVASFARAGQLAAEECDPGSDMHGSADYRRAVAGAYVERALDKALQRSSAFRGHTDIQDGGAL
jgi:CO/xanthine dehydrogenase FAD-binding subunit